MIVSGAASLLETETSGRGGTVESAQAIALPLNGRSYADLAQLVPGVRRSLLGTVASNPPRDASYNVNGLTSQSNNFTLDGIDNNAYQEANQGYSNEAVIPSPDAIQEFKVQTDNYSAEYGRAGGAIINATTRSGTNAFHGGAYDYLRNTVPERLRTVLRNRRQADAGAEPVRRHLRRSGPQGQALLLRRLRRAALGLALC